MTVPPLNKAMLASYARAFVATALTAAVTVSQTSGKLPTDFSGSEWMAMLNSLWIALVPVLIRWVNPKDIAFGRTSTN